MSNVKTKPESLPAYQHRALVGGRIPMTRAEWNTMPSEYQNPETPSIIYWSDQHGTTLAPVVIVETSQIVRARPEAVGENR